MTYHQKSVSWPFLCYNCVCSELTMYSHKYFWSLEYLIIYIMVHTIWSNLWVFYYLFNNETRLNISLYTGKNPNHWRIYYKQVIIGKIINEQWFYQLNLCNYKQICIGLLQKQYYTMKKWIIVTILRLHWWTKMGKITF